MTRSVLGRGTSKAADSVPPLPWSRLGVYVAVAFGGAWAVASPLWWGAGLAEPTFPVLGLLLMFTPALGVAAVAALGRRRGEPWPELGFSWGRRAAGATVGSALLVPLLTLTALSFSAALGTVAFPSPVPDVDRALAGVPSILLGVLVVAIPVLGEEIGWRGWLLPRLMPLGAPAALVASGAVWGLWHAPLILLGYNYGRPDLTGLTFMVVFSVLTGVLLGALRLWTESLWPAVAAHAAINASVGAWNEILLGPARVDPAEATLLGWPGWLLLSGLVVAVPIAAMRRRPTSASAAPAGRGRA